MPTWYRHTIMLERYNYAKPIYITKLTLTFYLKSNAKATKAILKPYSFFYPLMQCNGLKR